MVKPFFVLSLIAALAALPVLQAAKPNDKESSQPSNMAVYLLKQLNEREQAAYERYETATTEEDVDQVRRELQSVIDGYESLTARADTYAPAFVSYGLMLNRTGNRKESYAILLRADELDPGIPVVKNQLGNYAAEEGKYAEAYSLYLMAQGLDPEQPLYHLQAGEVLQAYRRHFIDDKVFSEAELDDQVQRHFRLAAKHAPKGDVSYKLRYAQSFFDVANPDWEKALVQWQQLRTAAGTEYEEQVVTVYIARVRFELGHHTAARKLLASVTHPTLDESKRKLLEEINLKYPQ